MNADWWKVSGLLGPWNLRVRQTSKHCYVEVGKSGEILLCTQHKKHLDVNRRTGVGHGPCRSSGAGFVLGCGCYKQVAPIELETERRRGLVVGVGIVGTMKFLAFAIHRNIVTSRSENRLRFCCVPNARTVWTSIGRWSLGMAPCRSSGAGFVLGCDAINRSLRWSCKDGPGSGLVGGVGVVRGMEPSRSPSIETLSCRGRKIG